MHPLLSANAEGDPAWHVLPFGCAAGDDDAEFWFVAGKSSQGSVFRGNATLGLLGGEAERATVKLRRLSSAFRTEHGIPAAFDLVKVDVEGAERSALQGLDDIEWRYLMVEVSHQREGRMTTDELMTLVRATHPGARVVTTLTADDACVELLLART